MKEEVIDSDEILKIVNEIKKLIKEERYKFYSNKDLIKDYTNEIIRLEEALIDYMGENDLKI